MKYLHLFETQQEHDTARSNDYKEPWVAYTEETESVSYNLPHDYSKDYLTIKSIDSGTITFSAGTGNSGTSYSIDGGQTWVSFSGEQTFNVNAGDYISFKALSRGVTTGVGRFSSIDCRFEAMGNMFSMVYSDDFLNQSEPDWQKAVYVKLFSGCTGLVSAENLINVGGYSEYMFKNCTSLTIGPKKLSGELFASYIYRYMFKGCTALIKAPELPATALTYQCYEYMFTDCTSLTEAPELPATTLAEYCYTGMFSGCTSLIAAPELPADTLYTNCYAYMFSGCTSLISMPELSATKLAEGCYQFMFIGCSSLTEVPSILPATTLERKCYYEMFASCSSLTRAPELPATTLVPFCYANMFEDCSSLSYIKMLATDISAANCLTAWVNRVASSGTFVKNSAAQWNVTGNNGVPSNWTVETASS